MSYQVLARKWRPKTFADIVGQDIAVRALTQALTRKHLHHAYLFTGTRGVGKTTLARILAKSLNCETGITAIACGTCSNCRDIDGGRFTDLLEVDAATNSKVEEMRSLLESSVYVPTRGRFKIYIIDEVHMLSTSAFNAMLKTLEEPPEHLKFILATTDPQKLPVTILSRCLQFNLRRIPREVICAQLQHILQQEGIAGDDAALAQIASAGNGSMRDALSILDQAIALGSGKVAADDVQKMLGVASEEALHAVLDALLAQDPKALVQVAESLSQQAASFDQSLQGLASLFLRLSVAQHVPDNTADGQRLMSYAQGFDREYLQLAYQITIHGRRDLYLAPDEQAGFVMTLLRLFAFRPETPETAHIHAETAPPITDAPTPAATPTARPIQPIPASAEEWHQLAGQMKLAPSVREIARHCAWVRSGENLLVLQLSAEHKMLLNTKATDLLRQEIQQTLNRPLRVNITAAADGEAVNTLQQHQEKSAQEDAFIREMKATFDTTDEQVSVKFLGRA